MYALLNVAFALLAGLLMTRIFSRWRLPDVTAFLVAGVLIGPFCLGRLGITGVGFAAYEDVAALGTISDVAMGFIAFAIGNEFRLEDLRKTGRQAFIIGIVQALVATVLVDLAMLGFHFLRPDILSAPAAITLGAIAAATAALRGSSLAAVDAISAWAACCSALRALARAIAASTAALRGSTGSAAGASA